MYMRLAILALLVFGASADHAASYAAHQIMSVVEHAVGLYQTQPIMFLLDPALKYSMCGYEGNRATFAGYLDSQMKNIVQVKFLTDFDNAYITKKDGFEYLTFHVDSHAIYEDKSTVEGGATVIAVKKEFGPLFHILKIKQRCRVTSKRHHRLYRVFTNENLYDYRRK